MEISTYGCRCTYVPNTTKCVGWSGAHGPTGNGWYSEVETFHMKVFRFPQFSLSLCVNYPGHVSYFLPSSTLFPPSTLKSQVAETEIESVLVICASGS